MGAIRAAALKVWKHPESVQRVAVALVEEHPQMVRVNKETDLDDEAVFYADILDAPVPGDLRPCEDTIAQISWDTSLRLFLLREAKRVGPEADRAARLTWADAKRQSLENLKQIPAGLVMIGVLVGAACLVRWLTGF